MSLFVAAGLMGPSVYRKIGLVCHLNVAWEGKMSCVWKTSCISACISPT